VLGSRPTIAEPYPLIYIANVLESRPSPETRTRLLEPVDRISELLFGLIMVLTFTGTISVATPDVDVSLLLRAAIGCNLAWGLVDGVMYVTMGLVERAHFRRDVRALQAVDAVAARPLITDMLPPVLADAFQESELDQLHRSVMKVPEVPPVHVGRDDLLGALAVALLVFGSTFPVVIPFLVTDDPTAAIRWSNSIAVLMMFACGVGLGRYSGMKPWKTGLAMTVLGVVLVVATIALGG
jgi:hypothetical protein